MKISAVYKITNEVTKDFYIGSSKDVKRRWQNHKCPSKWAEQPNSLLYKDMRDYGLDKFSFEIVAEVEPEYLKEEEQKYIEMLQPSYNNSNAKGLDIKRRNERLIKYQQSGRGYKVLRKSIKKYQSHLCLYNGETLSFNALACRFNRAGIPHPFIEAKKYLI